MARIIIITSSQLRHKYFVNSLDREHDIMSVVSEGTQYSQLKVKQSKLISNHFRERDDRELYYFGSLSRAFHVHKRLLRVIPCSETNSLETFHAIAKVDFDFIVIYGSSIIKEPLLSFAGDRIINMHLGLSPYYRGSGTNFWPLVNEEPECVGVTIHHAVLKVDAGELIAQTRPEVKLEDRCHDYGCKAIMAGTKLMSRVLSAQADGPIVPVAQEGGGRLYRVKDFNSQALKRMHANFCSGMNERYLASKAERDASFAIKSLE
jgi:methionyl-tRNA formyltransferase